jgi:hypothetical protein
VAANEPDQNHLPKTLFGRALLGVALFGFIVAVALFAAVAFGLPD